MTCIFPPHAKYFTFFSLILSYIHSALKIFKAAEECRLDRDEERAYVLYMKFMTVYNLIKKRPDFKQQQVPFTFAFYSFFLHNNRTIDFL
jgi:hypothetical protein